MVMIFGEITTASTVNYEQVIRDAIKQIGYDDVAKGLDYQTMNVIVAIEEQSPDIAQSVDSRWVGSRGGDGEGCMTWEVPLVGRARGLRLTDSRVLVRQDGQRGGHRCR